LIAIWAHDEKKQAVTKVWVRKTKQC